MKNLFGKCGFNCGHCPAYIANAKTLKDRRKCSDGWRRYFGVSLKPERCVCLGCQAKDPWKTGNLLPDRSCYVRPCVIQMNIKTCAPCPWFPCEDLVARIPGKDIRKRVESRIGKPVSEKDYHALIEPYEGIKHLHEMRTALGKDDIVDKPLINPLKTRIASFPNKLRVLKSERAAFEKLYEFMTEIITGHAKTHARQILMKRRKPHMLGLLWAFGRYGWLKKGKRAQLVIDSGGEGSKPQLGYFVRKRDNQLYDMYVQSFRIIKVFGARGEFVAKKPHTWQLKLSFDMKAGGVSTLGALKRYVTELIAKYGEAKYAGSSQLKGKAYSFFAKADMNVLS